MRSGLSSPLSVITAMGLKLGSGWDPAHDRMSPLSPPYLDTELSLPSPIVMSDYNRKIEERRGEELHKT